MTWHNEPLLWGIWDNPAIALHLRLIAVAGRRRNGAGMNLSKRDTLCSFGSISLPAITCKVWVGMHCAIELQPIPSVSVMRE